MIKKLSKHGNSLALLLDKPILELLEADENTYFKITIEGKTLIVEPVCVETTVSTISEDPHLQELYKELFKKHNELFKKLADS